MENNSLIGLLIVGSFIALVFGIIRLVLSKNWLKLFYALTILLLYPAILWVTSQISDDHLRMWVGLLVVVPIPLWLLSGYFIYSLADDQPSHDSTIIATGNNSLKLRIKGVVALFLGIPAWSYGAFHPQLAKWQEITLVVIALYGIVLGIYWTVTGRSIYGD